MSSAEHIEDVLLTRRSEVSTDISPRVLSSNQNRTLNPKLTRRAVRPPPPTQTVEEEEEERREAFLAAKRAAEQKDLEENEESSDESSTETEEDGDGETHGSDSELSILEQERRIKSKSLYQVMKLAREKVAEEKARYEEALKANPNAHLLHPGSWTPKQWVTGRPVRLTGVWTCCGDGTQLSLYCSSVERRAAFKKEHEDELKEIEKENAYREFKTKTLKVPWDNNEIGFKAEAEPTAEDIAVEYAGSLDSSFNAPMLTSWLFKHVDEELTVSKGLDFLLNHLESGEGCELMLKHGIIGALKRVHMHYRDDPLMQLQVITSLKKLLDCNYTRDEMITTNLDVLRMSITIAHKHMMSREHVDMACRCVAQCSRSELCRREIIQKRLFAYFVNFCKRYSSTPSILRSCLKLFNWVSTTDERLVTMCEAKVVPLILRIMGKHMRNADVLAPAMLFLTRAAKPYPPALDLILKLKAIPLIINVLKALYSNEILQVEGLKMLQTLSKTSEGWKQISETRGGWQSICQGTVMGDALVHDLQGSLHNHGWSIGDTPHLPLVERQKIMAAQVMLNRTRGLNKTATWTSHSLRDFMGISMKQTKLAINNEYHETFFELLTTLELLPHHGEDKETWFKRLNTYETESEIKIEEMVNTLLDLRRKEAMEAKKAKVEVEDERRKEVFVLGEKITTKLLAESDISLDERMRGVKSNA